MQDVYVFNKEHIISQDELIECIKKISDIFHDLYEESDV